MQTSETCKQTQTSCMFLKATCDILLSANFVKQVHVWFTSRAAVFPLVNNITFMVVSKSSCVFKPFNDKLRILPRTVEGKLIVLSCNEILELAET